MQTILIPIGLFLAYLFKWKSVIEMNGKTKSINLHVYGSFSYIGI